MNDIYQQNTYRGGNDGAPYQSVFHKKTEKINWKKLAAIEIDKVIQSNDVNALRENIKHIAFCDIDAEMELRGGDRTLAKMFKMAQLMVDYLLSSQEHLAGVVNEAEERCAAMAEEAEAAKRKAQECEAYIGDLKRECHRRKKLILAQQQIMDSGPEAYHRCPYCVKAFLNGSFLQAHLEKRHSERYLRHTYEVEERERWRHHRRRESSGSPRREGKDGVDGREGRDLRSGREEEVRRAGDDGEAVRRAVEEALLRQREEMRAVVGDLEQRLAEASRPQVHRSRSHLGDLLDDRDDRDDRSVHDEVSAQRARELAVKKAVSDRQRQKQAAPPTEERSKKARGAAGGLGKALGASRLSCNVVSLSPLETGSTSADDLADLDDDSLSARESLRANGRSNNNDYGAPRSSPDLLTSASPPSSRQFDYRAGRVEPQPVAVRRQPRQTEATLEVRGTVQPLQGRASPDRRPVSVSSGSRASEDADFDKLWADSEDYRVRTRLEVVEMLTEHLENHGIKRTATGIPEGILNDKLVVVGLEQRQLGVKYIDFADIRKRLVAEVESEAAARLREGQRGPTEVRTPLPPKASPQRPRQAALPARDSPASSGSDWDDRSVSEDRDTRRDNLRQQKEALRRDKIAYEAQLEDIERSPRQRNNARASSEMSNSMNSSMWGPSESRAVTSVAPPQHAQRPPASRSSDLGGSLEDL